MNMNLFALFPHRILRGSGCRTRKALAKRGFSLIELLTVLTIVGLLTVLSLPAVSGLSQSGNVNYTVNGLSLLLGQARAYAMAHNTYVWVGFYQNSSASPQQLAVGVVAGTTGQVTDIATPSTYEPISKVQSFHNFELNKSITGLTGMNTTSVTDVGSSKVVAFYQALNGATDKFTSTLQFDPEGEASIATSPTPQWVQIGLQPAYGGNTSNPNVAVFQVATLTGQVAVFRR